MLSIRLCAVAALAASGVATAQTAQTTALPTFASALAGYQPYRDEKPANWRDVNDTMAVLGGHNAHLREIGNDVTATGTIVDIDRATGRVRIDGDAVKALGWPAGIAFWQLARPALADRINPGERVTFKLETDGEVYRISGFEPNLAPAPAAAARTDPHAGHNMGGKK
jgi:Cu/Ag efflux protein CusF